MKNLFINKEDIIDSINHLKVKIVRTPEKFLHFLLRILFLCLYFQFHLFSVVPYLMYQNSEKFPMLSQFTKKETKTTLLTTDQYR